ncbi:MAG: isoprenylcysteine carboxylmethyltransferase family protein [Candidatus Thorarchaeota archaeon]
MTADETTNLTSSTDILTTMVGTLVLIQLLLFFLLFSFQTNIYILGLGWCMLVPGFALVITSVNHLQKFNNESKLSSGIYRVVRHPMYIGWIIISVGMALISQQWFTILYAIIIPVIFIIAMKREEEDNVMKFGDDYNKYKSEVPMLNIVLGFWRNQRMQKNREIDI